MTTGSRATHLDGRHQVPHDTGQAHATPTLALLPQRAHDLGLGVLPCGNPLNRRVRRRLSGGTHIRELTTQARALDQPAPPLAAPMLAGDLTASRQRTISSPVASAHCHAWRCSARTQPAPSPGADPGVAGAGTARDASPAGLPRSHQSRRCSAPGGSAARTTP